MENQLSFSRFTQILSQPKNATAATYNTTDSAGNVMQCISVIELFNSPNKYAAVYHTPYAVEKSHRFKINLSVSDDLVSWTYVGLLVDNADMPEIRRADSGDWIVLVHEQWIGNPVSGPSLSPCQIGFKLFCTEADLLNCKIDSTWTADLFPGTQLNGTPNFYTCHLQQDSKNNWEISADIGFHFFDTLLGRDIGAYATVSNLFSPDTTASWVPMCATNYNEDLFCCGVTGNIGQRCNISIGGALYNVQEANVGQPETDWDKWRIFIYQFNDSDVLPDGSGNFLEIFPQTPGGSYSFGNPRVSVVSTPGKTTKSLVVSYFLFAQGVPSNVYEAGGLLFHTEI